MLHIIFIFFSFLVSSFFLGLMSVAYKSWDKEKAGPFECGFSSKGDSRLQFCMKFFLVGVIFLVFDVEVTLVLPLPYRHLSMVIFLFVLLLGLLFEWNYGGLDWL